MGRPVWDRGHSGLIAAAFWDLPNIFGGALDRAESAPCGVCDPAIFFTKIDTDRESHEGDTGSTLQRAREKTP